MPVINGLNFTDNNPPGTPLIGWDNQIDDVDLTASSEEVGYPVTNLANPATHLYWQAALDTGGTYTLRMNNIEGTTDYIAIAGHNFGSAGISIKLEAVMSDSPLNLVNLLDAGSPGFVTVDDDSPLILRFASGTYPAFLLTFDVPADLPRATVLYAGELLVLERGIKVDVTHVPITYGRRARVVSGMSESGNFLGRIFLSESRVSQAEFFGFTPNFYRENIDEFLASAETDPFFWAWAPAEYPSETGFVWLTEDARPEVSPDHRHIALTLTMAGIVGIPFLSALAAGGVLPDSGAGDAIGTGAAIGASVGLISREYAVGLFPFVGFFNAAGDDFSYAVGPGPGYASEA